MAKEFPSFIAGMAVGAALAAYLMSDKKKLKSMLDKVEISLAGDEAADSADAGEQEADGASGAGEQDADAPDAGVQGTAAGASDLGKAAAGTPDLKEQEAE